MGVKITDIYWTLGDHDGVLIFEAADDETATTLLLHLGIAGNVHTTTVRAFTAAEIKIALEIVSEFPSGVSDSIKRAVSENATSLGFKTRDWE